MNILIISPYFNYSCGVSKHVYLLLCELSRISNINLFFATNGGDGLSRLNSLNINISIFSFRKGWKNIFFLIPNYLSLKHFCFLNKITVIHSHHRYPEFLAWIVSKRLKIRTVTTCHSFVRGFSIFSLKSDMVIAVSESIKFHIIKYFNIEKSRISMLHNFVIDLNATFNTEGMFSVSNLQFNSKDKILLFVGRINKIKGADIVIDSFISLISRYNDIYLFLVGSFELDNSYFDKIRINPRIILQKPTNDVSRYLNLCYMVLLPSRIDPFPYVMLEAGLFSKPFIGGNTGGIAEFISHKNNGLLVEPGVKESLITAIEWLLNDPEEAGILGDNLHVKVTHFNSAEKYLNSLLEIYET